MHSHIGPITLVLLLLSLLFIGCNEPEPQVPDPQNAIYYWRQELRLNESEKSFLHNQHIGKVYLHLFDVVRQQSQLRPNATLDVSEPLPSGIEVIPVVFLAHNLLSDTTGLAQLPQLLARRVDAMMQQNQLGPLTELQIDFDWTKRNQARYFELLTQIRHELDLLPTSQQGRSIRLSTTIRLHQLGMEAPPVDYGSLMVYNLGHIQEYTETNSILNEQVLQDYLRYLRGYTLPLCTALPVYSWDLLFHDQEFQCILRNIDLSDTTRFQAIDPAHYRAISYQVIPPNGVSLRADGRIYPGDLIRHEYVTYQVLRHVRQTIAERRPSACQQIILYHLDERQLKQYTDEELQTIYSGH